MDIDKLTDKVFASRYMHDFSRMNSFLYRQQHYPEILVDISNYGKGELYIGLCFITDKCLVPEDVSTLLYYSSFFRTIYPGEDPFFRYYIVQNMEELECCYPVIGEFPDFEFVFFNDRGQKTFYNREVYEY